ncbi:MAG: bifunctional riboflavin kinase/FAD synthetase [Anaerolineae bacterium]
MRVIGDLTKANLNGPSLVTVGSYDGVHIGHQHLLGQMRAAARKLGYHTSLVTFHPQPRAVLAPHLLIRYLTTPAEKIGLLEALGLDLVAILPFTRETAQTSAGEFVEKLVAHLNMRQLWIGPDFALGRNREGNIPTLRDIGRHMGFEVHVVEPLIQQGGVVSSTRIRNLLMRGEIRQATSLLGRYPSISGQVVQGAQRGRLLGFPTANLSVLPERAIPADGVYACFVWVNNERYPAVANIGVRPSFAGAARTVETHLLDFEGDLYGLDIKMEFVERLRPEKRFVDLDDLAAQIRADSEQAARLLAQEPPV